MIDSLSLYEFLTFDESKNTERAVSYKPGNSEEIILNTWMRALKIIFQLKSPSAIKSIFIREISKVDGANHHLTTANIELTLVELPDANGVIQANSAIGPVHVDCCANSYAIVIILGGLMKRALPVYDFAEFQSTSMRSSYWNIREMTLFLGPTSTGLAMDGSVLRCGYIQLKLDSNTRSLYETMLHQLTLIEDRQKESVIRQWQKFFPASKEQERGRNDGT